MGLLWAGVPREARGHTETDHLAAPASINCVSESPGTIKVTWGAVTGADEYLVVWGDPTTRLSDGSEVIRGNPLSTSYVITEDITTGVDYLVVVHAYDKDDTNDAGFWNHSTIETTSPHCRAKARFTTPSRVRVRELAGGALVSWEAVENASGYTLRVGSGNPMDVSGTEKELTGLTNPTEYRVSVRAKPPSGSRDWLLSNPARSSAFTPYPSGHHSAEYAGATWTTDEGTEGSVRVCTYHAVSADLVFSTSVARGSFYSLPGVGEAEHGDIYTDGTATILSGQKCVDARFWSINDDDVDDESFAIMVRNTSGTVHFENGPPRLRVVDDKIPAPTPTPTPRPAPPVAFAQASTGTNAELDAMLQNPAIRALLMRLLQALLGQ